MRKNRFWRSFYNIIAPLYDPFFGADTIFVRDMRKRIVERLELEKGDRVAEIAVGTGANLQYISEKIGPKGRISGLDISEAMLGRCRKNMKKKGLSAELTLGDAEKLPYETGSFDAVLCFGIFNHVDHQEKVLSELIRIAKPDAKIVIGDEIFPFLVNEPKKLPGSVKEIKHSVEKAVFSFWIMEFRKV